MSTLRETHGLIPSSMITIGPRPSRGSQTGPGGESPVGKVLGINDDALWISTAEDNPRLFCRRNLSDDATLPLTSIQDISSGMSEYI